jgi:hypothetical protein
MSTPPSGASTKAPATSHSRCATTRSYDRFIDDEAPASVPSRTAYLLAFAAVVVSGLLGGTIGYGIVDVSCEGGCTLAVLAGALVGAACGAGGVGVIAVLVLRAMAEWKRARPPG